MPIHKMKCRAQCGACCIAPDISSSIPGMPNGKPAGVPCIHLDNQYRCRLFGKQERPKVCLGFQPEYLVCGDSREEALQILTSLV
jgi:Fe-S-cluster containining protein